MEEIDRAFVQTYASQVAEAALGPDDRSIELPDLKAVNSADQKMMSANQPRLVGLVRAWCRKNDQESPALMDPANPQLLVRTLEQAGLFDFERLSLESLPSLCRKVGAWPNGMAQTHLLGALELTETDLDFEEREAQEKRRQAEIGRRTITFSGKAIDTGAADFDHISAEIANTALAAGSDWYTRSRPPRLAVQEQQGADSRRGRHGSGRE